MYCYSGLQTTTSSTATELVIIMTTTSTSGTNSDSSRTFKFTSSLANISPSTSVYWSSIKYAQESTNLVTEALPHSRNPNNVYNEGESASNRGGLIIGGATGGVAGILLVFLVVTLSIFLARKKWSNKKKQCASTILPRQLDNAIYGKLVQ